MLMQISVLLTFISIFISGVNKDTAIIAIAISILATGLGLVSLLKNNKKIVFPKNFALMIIFALILHIYLLFVQEKVNPFYFASIISEGIVYWLIYYNIKDGGIFLRKIFILLTIVYTLLFFVSKVLNIDLLKLSELLFEYGGKSRHWDVGDLWSFTMILLLYENFLKLKFKTTILIILGFVFITISGSRSSYVSLIAGVTYLYSQINDKVRKMMVFGIPILLLTTILFISASINRSILFSRPYFAQSIESLPKYPLGVGMGNFKEISLGFIAQNNDSDLNGYSTYTHNLYLEALSGIGLFSIFFLIFIIKSMIEILKNNKVNSVWAAVFLAMTVNFMFDLSYSIPGMIWLWFMVYGTFQKENNFILS